MVSYLEERTQTENNWDLYSHTKAGQWQKIKYNKFLWKEAIKKIIKFVAENGI